VAGNKDIRVAREAFSRGEFATARRLLQRQLRRAPRDAAANELMAYVAGRGGDQNLALEYLQVATGSPEATPTAWYYLGFAHLRAHRYSDAEEAFQKALRLDHHFFEAAHDLGRALHEQRRFDDALAAYLQAKRLKAASAPLFHNMGRTYAALGRYEEALRCYDEALALESTVPDTWLNRGEVLHDLGNFEAALKSYGRAIELRPQFHEAISNRGLTLLTLGDYALGWPAFEARWLGQGALRDRHSGITRWRGSDMVEGKRILAWCEQGIGDTIQFFRFVGALEERGAIVVLEVQPHLKALMEDSFHGEVIAAGEQIPAVDYQIPLMSIPGELCVRVDSIPVGVPYLRAQDEKLRQWQQRLRRKSTKPVVALACSGNPSHKYEERRRIPLAAFAELSRRCQIYLAQKDLHRDDGELLGRGDTSVEFLGDEMLDLRDAAAITACVDLVLTVDTSLCHVAGAMGRPVWLMLSSVSDWRWMTGSEDTPWYPTTRLLRQNRAGSWTEVLNAVESEIDRI
jgi:tetratricopeptide (TPR) repeat protein